MPSRDFLEKLLLLVLTALISGFLVPYVLKQIEERRTIEQREREAKLARQAKLIEAQAQLLETMLLTIWEWRYAYMRVTYYGSHEDQTACQAAWTEYSNRVWGLLSQFRYQVSRSGWLVSETQQCNLLKFYNEIIEMDKKLFHAQSTTDPFRRSLEFSDLNQHVFTVVSGSIDRLASELANELGLSVAAQPDVKRDKRWQSP